MEEFSVQVSEAPLRKMGREEKMNFYDRKTRKIISTIIIAVIILAMVIPLLLYAF